MDAIYYFEKPHVSLNNTAVFEVPNWYHLVFIVLVFLLRFYY